MEKETKNWKNTIKIVMMTIFIFLTLVIIFYFIRNAVILNRLTNLLNSNINSNNYFYKYTIKDEERYAQITKYKKDNQFLIESVAYYKGEAGGTIIVYCDGNEVTTIQNNQTISVEKAEDVNYNELLSDVIGLSQYTEWTTPDMIFNSEIIYDKSENTYLIVYHGEKCWVNAENGFPTRIILGEEFQKFTFEFNQVTDEEMENYFISAQSKT